MKNKENFFSRNKEYLSDGLGMGILYSVAGAIIGGLVGLAIATGSALIVAAGGAAAVGMVGSLISGYIGPNGLKIWGGGKDDSAGEKFLYGASSLISTALVTGALLVGAHFFNKKSAKADFNTATKTEKVVQATAPKAAVAYKM